MMDPQDKMMAAHSRRTFLTRAAVAGLGVAALGLSSPARAATTPQQPEADSGHDYTMKNPNPMNEKAWRMAIIGPATLSLKTSEIAVDKASHPMVKEFANFELREQIGMGTCLKEMKTPVPPMTAEGKAVLEKLKSSSGAEFDKAFIAAQLSTHEFLRDVTASYLKNSAGKPGMPEMHGRHMAILALGTLKEHVVHTKNLTQALKGA